MIYLLRHGDAEPDLGDGDAARRLTPKGEEQARLAGLAIARLGYGIDACLTSPRVRALDTARIACLAIGLEPEVSEPIGDGSYQATDLAAGRGDVERQLHGAPLSNASCPPLSSPTRRRRSDRLSSIASPKDRNR